MATQTKEKEIVIKAIDDLGRAVTAADVAAKTGLPILVTTSELNKIASETQGHLAVSTTGDIAYKFDFGFQNAYLAKGIALAIQQIMSALFKAGYFLLRISFGIMLVVSFIIVLLLIIGLLMYMSKGSDRDDDRGFSFDFFDYLILRDLFFWGTYSTYGGQVRYDQPTTRVRQKSNFLLNCFSFLFGDGNPNLHLDERRWQFVAQLIKANQGTVVAEQLAPYTDAQPGNEDGALPVLVRFDGKPEVTEKGNIVYLFPSLQVSAASSEMEKARLPAFLREYPWQFTAVLNDDLIPVYVLAGLNFFGSWWLLSQIHNPFLFHFAPLITVLVIYGSLFVLVPLIRFMAIQWLNNRIEKRNACRQEIAESLRAPQDDLALKFKEARALTIKEKQITAKDVVYTTDKDALEQEFDATS